MKAEYFKKQIDASMEEIIGAISHAMLVAMDSTDTADALRREHVEDANAELGNVSVAILRFLDATTDDEVQRISDSFHGALAEDLPFASVPLEDGGEQE